VQPLEQLGRQLQILERGGRLVHTRSHLERSQMETTSINQQPEAIEAG
jgi:hypothetical protein